MSEPLTDEPFVCSYCDKTFTVCGLPKAESLSDFVARMKITEVRVSEEEWNDFQRDLQNDLRKTIVACEAGDLDKHLITSEGMILCPEANLFAHAYKFAFVNRFLLYTSNGVIRNGKFVNESLRRWNKQRVKKLSEEELTQVLTFVLTEYSQRQKIDDAFVPSNTKNS